MLLRHAGTEARVTFSMLTALLLSANGVESLQQVNPFLEQDAAEEVLQSVGACLVLACRAGQASRALLVARELQDALRHARTLPLNSATAADADRTVQAKSSALAELLVARRHYMKSVQCSELGRLEVEYDPRFLAFEFVYNLLLHKPQVQLVQRFITAAEGGGSLCHQMLMGAGKTTVVAPLLSLILADGAKLVVQVVPAELLDFSRGELRRRLGAVAGRTVYTLEFNRFAEVTPALQRKLELARAARAAVVTSPTAIKSLLLKFVEVMHILEQSGSHQGSLAEPGAAKLVGLLGLAARSQPRSSPHEWQPGELQGLREEAARCVSVFEALRDTVLVLDEVDLLLHPLKSELHWPVGAKLPLDFAQAAAGDGLRWRIPFHLLDALFFACTGRCTDQWSASHTAGAALEAVKEAVTRGIDTHALQRTPHLVLLNRSFYDAALLPALASWMLVWFNHRYPIRGMTDAEVLAYLVGQGGLGDDSMKMLNLSRQWLTSVMPHVLGKINRVGFGLLTAADLRQQPAASQARRLLAVPFLGKDIPSRTNEFSHPDVVIGLTILAYRLEGLRRSDLRRLLERMKECADTELGPHHDRPTCKRYMEWIHAAGGRVKGARKRTSRVGARGLLLSTFQRRDSGAWDPGTPVALGSPRSFTPASSTNTSPVNGISRSGTPRGGSTPPKPPGGSPSGGSPEVPSPSNSSPEARECRRGSNTDMIPDTDAVAPLHST
ncbi:hypothetical protein CYMTET_53053 [Cymbomonas tetramitiformis]|uniref:ubiquitinyl hydrolase 1 n=1 Tax=Cymbomonas tetramitiformis TaxID=36881 RepID=A0AAE0BIY1_9CHLO|nr:hypothetical protein CYMTET_53053 [Cymbomonas tetramitiformis]